VPADAVATYRRQVAQTLLDLGNEHPAGRLDALTVKAYTLRLSQHRVVRFVVEDALRAWVRETSGILRDPDLSKLHAIYVWFSGRGVFYLDPSERSRVRDRGPPREPADRPFALRAARDSYGARDGPPVSSVPRSLGKWRGSWTIRRRAEPETPRPAPC